MTIVHLSQFIHLSVCSFIHSLGPTNSPTPIHLHSHPFTKSLNHPRTNLFCHLPTHLLNHTPTLTHSITWTLIQTPKIQLLAQSHTRPYSGSFSHPPALCFNCPLTFVLISLIIYYSLTKKNLFISLNHRNWKNFIE